MPVGTANGVTSNDATFGLIAEEKVATVGQPSPGLGRRLQRIGPTMEVVTGTAFCPVRIEMAQMEIEMANCAIEAVVLPKSDGTKRGIS